MPHETPPDSTITLPHAGDARVQQSKICDYLLSVNHPIGRFKAAFFGALGYTVDDWERLQRDLLQHGRSGKAVPGRKSLYGQKFEVYGIFAGPSGRRVNLVTVWIILNGEASPQFVTAFPGESS
jgi:uncharacterized protein DUF6883